MHSAKRNTKSKYKSCMQHEKGEKKNIDDRPRDRDEVDTKWGKKHSQALMTIGYYFFPVPFQLNCTFVQPLIRLYK